MRYVAHEIADQMHLPLLGCLLAAGWRTLTTINLAATLSRALMTPAAWPSETAILQQCRGNRACGSKQDANKHTSAYHISHINHMGTRRRWQSKWAIDQMPIIFWQSCCTKHTYANHRTMCANRCHDFKTHTYLSSAFASQHLLARS